MKKTTEIKSHAELQQRIKTLEILQIEQEGKIRRNLEEIKLALQPKTILKNAWKDLGKDPDIQRMTGKLGIDIGLNYFVGKLFGSKMSFKKHLSAVAVEKATGFLLSGIQSSYDHHNKIKETNGSIEAEEIKF